MVSERDIVREDESEYLRLLFSRGVTEADLKEFNRRLLDRQIYHWGLILVKMLDLRKMHKLKIHISNKTNGKLRWNAYERILHDIDE